jgi:hypothetical protein
VIVPKFELLLVKPCKIMVFDERPAMATRIVSTYPRSYAFVGRNTFETENTQGGEDIEISTDQIVEIVADYFEGAR